jgi:hypothetical protein
MNWTSRQQEAAAAMELLTFEVLRNPMALNAPLRFLNALGKESIRRVIWDSGASISISPSKKDFVGEFTSAPITVRLMGLAKGLRICGKGHVMWAFQDTTGQLRLVKVPAYYVPSSPVRLLSTTSLLQTYNPETILAEAHQLTLSGTSDSTRGPVVASVDPTNNLPTTQAHYFDDVMPALTDLNILSATLSVVSLENSNLLESEKELLRWHF